MRIGKVRRLALVSLVLIVLVMTVACTGEKVAPSPPGIEYNICEGVQLTKVSWSIGTGDWCWFELGLKNTTTSEQEYIVELKVDELPRVENLPPVLGPFKPGEEKMVALMSILKTTYPAKLYISVTPFK